MKRGLSEEESVKKISDIKVTHMPSGKKKKRHAYHVDFPEYNGTTQNHGCKFGEEGKPEYVRVTTFHCLRHPF